MVDPQMTNELLQRLLTRMDFLEFSVMPKANAKVDDALGRLDYVTEFMRNTKDSRQYSEV